MRHALNKPNFVVWRVQVNLGDDLLKAYFNFRDAVYDEANNPTTPSGANRRVDSGFVIELQTQYTTWAEILGSDNGSDNINSSDTRHLYIVEDKPSKRIVGMIRFAPFRTPPEYTNVLYLNQSKRGAVKPHEVFADMCDFYNFTKVKAGRIESPDGKRHVGRCGFEPNGQSWLWKRKPA